MTQRHATYENLNWSHQISCEKSFQTVYGLPIFADPRVWLLIFKYLSMVPAKHSFLAHNSMQNVSPNLHIVSYLHERRQL